MRIVDLAGGAEANDDEQQAGSWGPITIQALKDWSFAVGQTPLVEPYTDWLIRKGLV